MGAIGSVLAAQLSRNTSLPVRLIVQSRDYYHALSQRDICIEREGLRQFYRGLQAELLPKPRHFHPSASNELITEESIEAERRKDESLQSVGPISSLFVTTKAQAVLSALQQLQPRLSSESTIVLMQNGAGLVDLLNDRLFVEEAQRPSFVIAVNSHGAFVKDWGGGSGQGLHTVWAGVGDIAFGILPNQAAQQAIQHFSRAPLNNPLLTRSASGPLGLADLPMSRPTQSLYSTVASLLACKELNPSWHTMSKLSDIQLQKVAVNCVINPLTTIYNVRNGFLQRNESIHPVAWQICWEASSVFARRAMSAAQQANSADEDVSDMLQFMEEHRCFPPGHALNAEVLFNRAMQVAQVTAYNRSSTLADLLAGKDDTEMWVMLLVCAETADMDAQRLHEWLCEPPWTRIWISNASERHDGRHGRVQAGRSQIEEDRQFKAPASVGCAKAIDADSIVLRIERSLWAARKGLQNTQPS